jgi:rhamnogalacturonyl hydrolase YesR
MTNAFRRAALVASILIVLARVSARADEPARATSAEWGAATLKQIDAAFYMPDRALYAEQINSGNPPRPAWTWDASVQLGALCSAARQQPQAYLPRAKAYAAALRTYRTTYHDLPGLDVNPPPKTPDRYYDDNAWICLSLLEAYQLTHDPADVALAKDAYGFLMSGEDAGTTGGGIYWHEDRPTSKNACSSGPAMLAAMALYRLDGEQKYLATAKRLYDWTCAHLQDRDGLVFDSISVPEGNLNRAKYPYNSATLIRAACALYAITHEKAYLDEAQRIARAAEKRFVQQSDGIIPGAGKLGVKLLEAFLELYDADHDDHWRQVVARCLRSLHDRHRNDAGWYPQDWRSPPPPAEKPIRLIDQAAPARAYWIAAEHGAIIPPNNPASRDTPG